MICVYTVWLRAMHLIFNVDYCSFSRCDDFQVRFIVCLSCPLFCVCFYYVLVLAVCFRAGTRLTVGRWNQSVLICNGFQVCVCVWWGWMRGIYVTYGQLSVTLLHTLDTCLFGEIFHACVCVNVNILLLTWCSRLYKYIYCKCRLCYCLLVSCCVWVHKRKKCFYVLGRFR